jgi:hypothetical protein
MAITSPTLRRLVGALLAAVLAFSAATAINPARSHADPPRYPELQWVNNGPGWAVFKNVGSVRAGAFYITVYDKSGNTHWYWMPGLAPGATGWVSDQALDAGNSSTCLNAFVDATRAVQERIESDNYLRGACLH